MLECLNDLVGLYSGDCECLDLTLQSENSYPFFILDDYDFSIPLTSIAAGQMCGDGGVLEVAQQALITGQNALISDFKTIIGNHYRTSTKKYNGAVGQLAKASSYKTFTSGKQGLEIKGVKGVFYVEYLAVKLQDSQTVSIYIYDNRGSTPIQTNINATGGQLTKKLVNLKLPLEDEFGSIEYKILYEYTGKAYDIKFVCGCSDDTYRKIQSWFRLGGIQASTDSRDEYTHGLLLSGYVECDVDSVICSLGSEMATKMVLSRLLQLYAIRALANKTIMSTKMNSFTTLNKPSLEKHVQKLQDQINWRLTWIFEKTDMTDNCWECVSELDIEVSSLII